MEDRRRRPRSAFSGWVDIATQGRHRLATALDLSTGGLGVQMTGPLLPLETKVTSEFSLPGISLPVALRAVVVWSEGERGRLGLRFDGVDVGLAELLESYLSGRF